MVELVVDRKQFSRWGHIVDGWYSSPYELQNKPGVFIVGTKVFLHPVILDVGESEDVLEAVLHAERARVWRRNATGGLLYSAIYTTESDSPFLSKFTRQNLVSDIRSREEPVCGRNDILERNISS